MAIEIGKIGTIIPRKSVKCADVSEEAFGVFSLPVFYFKVKRPQKNVRPCSRVQDSWSATLATHCPAPATNSVSGSGLPSG